MEGHDVNGLIQCPSCTEKVSLAMLEEHYKECVFPKKKMNKKIICDICGKSLTRLRHMRAHMKIHMRKEQGKEYQEDSDLFYYCDQCGQKFMSYGGLFTHRKTHDKVTYDCPECPETFIRPDYLKRHINKMHSTEEKYQCKHCNRRFDSVTRRNNHELSHSGPQFQCSHCEKKLSSEKNLLSHERMHTGEKPFACKICSSTFTSPARLAQHEKGVHHLAGKRGGKTGWYRKTK